MNYRAATEQDILQLIQVNFERSPKGLRVVLGEKLMEKYFGLFYDEGNPFFVAEEDGAVVGYVMGYYKGSKAKATFEAQNENEINARLQEMSQKGNEAAIRCLQQKKDSINQVQPVICTPESRYPLVLFSLAVSSRYEGRGIGKALTNGFIALARSDGRANEICLQAVRDNVVARKLYETCGFRLIEQRDTTVWYEYIL